MKQRIKRNNRKKADFGASTLIASIIGSILSAGATIGSAAMNAKTQKEIADRQQRQATLADNEFNAQMAMANQSEALNYNQNEEILTAKTGSLSTLNNQFCFGGKRRMKRAGGTVSANVKGLCRYI